MSRITSFKDLDIWRKGIELVKEIYMITGKFPNNELYVLTSQMRRSAISIPSNTAEGFRRRHAKEFKHFLDIAIGSAAELETQIILAKELHYFEDEEHALELIDHISRMIANLIKRL
jgi:four helix bundle protein